jgi:opacity protein-like surface antigen
MSPISKIALGALASMLLGGTAMAADLMAPPPPAAAMTSDWTGGYIGLQGSLSRDSSAANSAAIDVVLGADFQTDMFLVGGRIWGGWTQSISGGGGNWDYGVEGRAGFVAGDMALLYGAIGDQSYASGVNFWTAGVGVEFKMGDSASLDLEYKHLWPGSGATLTSDQVLAGLHWRFH